MTDTTVKKVSAGTSPAGPDGQRYLVSGTSLSMRLWEKSEADKGVTARDYETVGYVVSGRAELEIEGQRVTLEPGDSWLVPPHAKHAYHIHERFVAVEATHPPARVHERDA